MAESNIIKVEYKDLEDTLHATTDPGIYKVQILDPENIVIGSSSLKGTLGYALRMGLGAANVLFDLTETDLTKATVKSLSSVFEDATNLVAIGSLPTNVINNATSMFAGCSNLKTADVSSLLKVTTFTDMFKGCSKLENLIVSKIFIENAKEAKNLLADCTALKSIISADSEHPAIINKNTDIQGTLVVREGIISQGNSSFSKDVTVNGVIHGELDGNAYTATQLKTARDIILEGDALGSASFNGSANAVINVNIDQEKYVTRDALNRDIAKLKVSTMQVVDSLPEEGEEGIIYLVLKSSDTLYNSHQSGNVFNEYLWEFNRDEDGNIIVGADGKKGFYELIGDTAVDLTDYVTRPELKAGFTFDGPVTAPTFESKGDIKVANNLVVGNSVVIQKGHLTVSNTSDKGGATIYGTVEAPDGFKGDLEGNADTASKVNNPLVVNLQTDLNDVLQTTFDGSTTTNLKVYQPDQTVNTDSDVEFNKLKVLNGIDGTASNAEKVEHKLAITQITNGVATTKEFDGSEDIDITIKSSNLTTNYVDDVADVDRTTTTYDGSKAVEQNIYTPDQTLNTDSEVEFKTASASDSFKTENVTIDQNTVKIKGYVESNTENELKNIVLYDLGSNPDKNIIINYTDDQLRDFVNFSIKEDDSGTNEYETDLEYAKTTHIKGSFEPASRFTSIDKETNKTVWPSSTDSYYVAANDLIGQLWYKQDLGNGNTATAAANYYVPFEGILQFKSFVLNDKDTVIATITPLRETHTQLEVNSNNITITKRYIDENRKETIDTTIIDGQSMVVNNIDARTINTTQIAISDPKDPDNIYNIVVNKEGDITINDEKIIVQSDYDDLLERLKRLEKKVEAFYSNSNTASAEITEELLKNWTGLSDVSGIDR